MSGIYLKDGTHFNVQRELAEEVLSGKSTIFSDTEIETVVLTSPSSESIAINNSGKLLKRLGNEPISPEF
jgi:hypothetical protein